MEIQRCPKVLVLSINCFSKNGSNGRVLSELFEGWDTDCLSQFYIYSEKPNTFVCKNYFRITDGEAMRSFFSWRKYGQKIVPEESVEVNVSVKRVNRNPLSYLCRDIIWRSGRWQSKKFWDWIEEFKPDCILLQADNSSFMPKLALKISKKYNLPIVIFNTENYYFKKHNYFTGKGFGFVYPFYRLLQIRKFRKLMKKSTVEIYNSKPLAELYEKEFGKKGHVIYQATSLLPFEKKESSDLIRFCYAGNLGLNRHKSLIEMAKALQNIDSSIIIDVYGNADKYVADELLQAKGIYYHGVVSYEEVLHAIKKSDFVCHVESFEPKMVKDLVTAFSTKISDYLASGRCFVLYADKTLACSKYLLENDCALVITNHDEMQVKLEELVKSISLQNRYIDNAVAIAKVNHNSKVNSDRFKQIILEVVKDRNNG